MNFQDYMYENYTFSIDIGDIEYAKNMIKACIDDDVPMYIIGNGGSGYSGSHFAQDLIKVCGAEAESLSENVGLILAVANDIDFKNVFKFQLERKKHGMLIAISCSGNSNNIIEAVQYANSVGMITMGFTGGNGGKLGEIVDFHINVPTRNIFISESFHQIIMHYIIDELKGRKMNFNELFPLQVYINLDKRTDRRILAEQEFSKLGIHPIRKSGFVPENIDNPWWKGAVGCMVSHYQILQAAALLDTNVFIWEDDFQFINDVNIEFIDMICDEVNSLGIDFDILYFSANILKPFKQIAPHLARLQHCQSTCGYGVHKSFLPKLLKSIDLTKISKPIDVIYSDMAPDNKFYITVPMLGVQRDSYSDIEGTEVNYTSYLEKRYWDNLIKMS